MHSLRCLVRRAVLLVALAPFSAQAQESCVQTYAGLIQGRSDTIELQVNAKCLAEGNVIDGVEYTIQFFDASGNLLGRMEFSQPTSIVQHPDVQVFQVSQERYPAATRAELIKFSHWPAHHVGLAFTRPKGTPPYHSRINATPMLPRPGTETTPTPTPTPISPEQGVCVPNLVVPGNGQRLPQRRLSNGQVESRWMFGWRACPGAKRYHLFVIGPQALNPIVDNDAIPSATYLHRDTHYGITQRNGWTWKVRAFVDGQWGNWSDESTFDVSPPK